MEKTQDGSQSSQSSMFCGGWVSFYHINLHSGFGILGRCFSHGLLSNPTDLGSGLLLISHRSGNYMPKDLSILLRIYQIWALYLY